MPEAAAAAREGPDSGLFAVFVYLVVAVIAVDMSVASAADSKPFKTQITIASIESNKRVEDGSRVCDAKSPDCLVQ